VGCGVTDANTKSYGKPFADEGGSVWVIKLAADRMGVCFKMVSKLSHHTIFTQLMKQRSQVPTGGFIGNTIDLNQLGTLKCSPLYREFWRSAKPLPPSSLLLLNQLQYWYSHHQSAKQ
jgi:hypothetical protein